MLWGAQLGPAVPRAEVYARLHGVQCRLASWPRFHFWEQDQPFFPCENYTLISSSSNMTEYIYYMNHGEPPMFICSAPYANSLVSAQTPNSYWHDSLARLFDPLFSRLSH